MDEPKKRRLPGMAWRDLKRAQQKLSDAVEDFRARLKRRGEDLGYYADQPNWQTGVVLDEALKAPLPVRVPRAVLAEVEKEQDDVRVLERAFLAKLDEVCERFDLRPKQVNVQTGDVADDDAEEVPEKR